MSVRVGFQGELGAFSEEAVRALYGEEVEPIPYREFRAVGEAVLSRDVEAGLLPVENSLAGSVVVAYDVLAELPLRVVAEIVRPIRHFLLGVSGAGLDDVCRVLSHPVALAQCAEFLRAHPEIEALAVYDTAGAAREVAEAADPSRAAIASRVAAERYGLDILAAEVQDRADNQTRFYAVVGSDGAGEVGTPPAAGRSGRKKTALLLETPNRPGSLVRVLEPFARRRINLSKLESRPGPVPWTYRFILEVECEDPDAEDEALRDVDEAAASLRVLGRFPAHTGAGG